MPSNEDLWRELQEQEQADDHRYKQAQAMREIEKRKPIATRMDGRSPEQRFKEDWSKRLEARRRVLKGLPPTKNPLYNAWLRLTGQDKLPQVDVVEPDKGLKLTGFTQEEIVALIASDPKRFADLAKAPVSTQKVVASKRTAEDLIRESEQRGNL